MFFGLVRKRPNNACSALNKEWASKTPQKKCKKTQNTKSWNLLAFRLFSILFVRKFFKFCTGVTLIFPKNTHAWNAVNRFWLTYLLRMTRFSLSVEGRGRWKICSELSLISTMGYCAFFSDYWLRHFQRNNQRIFWLSGWCTSLCLVFYKVSV